MNDNLPVPQSTPPNRPEPPVETRWKPGVSGNPGGRPKGLQRRVRELVGDDGDKLAVFLAGVVNDKKQKTADRLEAARILLDRGWGKPAITMSDGDAPAKFVLLSAFAVAPDGTVEEAA